LLRFYAIDRGSVWMDEATSIDFARMPLGEFLTAVQSDEANMAFYHLVLRLFLLFGESALVVRSLSALCGVATILLVYVLGRRLFDERVGLVAAALFSGDVFHIWFSQEARGYSLAVLLVCISTYLFLAIVERPDRPAPRDRLCREQRARRLLARLRRLHHRVPVAVTRAETAA
jgi:uncharacterized membrane protein